MKIEARLEELGLALPAPVKLPPGVELSFAWIRIRGDRAYISGHGPLNPDGSPAGSFGKVGSEVSPEEGYEAARLTALAMLGSLKRELGDLDRVSAWLVVHGLVNAEPGFAGTTNVMNGYSDLILSLYGSEAGTHARTAIARIIHERLRRINRERAISLVRDAPRRGACGSSSEVP